MEKKKENVGLIKFLEEGKMNKSQMKEINGGGLFRTCYHRLMNDYCSGGYNGWFRDCLDYLEF